jgi:hypothetical protein
MNRRRMLEIAATIAFGVNLAAAYVIGFVWTPFINVETGVPVGFDFGPEQAYLFLHVALVFLLSFLFGAIIADTTKTLVYTIVAAAIGVILATAIITAPAIIYAESVDTTMTVALVAVVKFLIVGVVFQGLGAILGSFLGNSLANRIEPNK